MQISVKILFISILFLSFKSQGQTKIYLIPGQGSDYRIFSKIKFPPNYEICHINYVIPNKGESLRAYAKRLSNQIPEGEKFILTGVSLGGMIATEIAEIRDPEKIIIISSAKNSNELPKRYNFQKRIPVYKLVGAKLSKRGAKVLQPIVEPDRNREKETFKSMLDSKDPEFLKRTIAMIINWERKSNSKEIIHIHGDNDKTVPIKNVEYDYLIKNGSHMMALTEAEKISAILQQILDE